MRVVFVNTTAYRNKEKKNLQVGDLIQRSDDPIRRLVSDRSCSLPSPCRCWLVGFLNVLFSGSLTANGQ